MIRSGKVYYQENNLLKDHNHYLLRARWIYRWMKKRVGRIIILGAGIGWTVHHLRVLGIEAIGLERSRYAVNNSVTPLEKTAIQSYGFLSYDNVFSWNVLDCLKGEGEAKAIANRLKVVNNQIHVLCTDNEDLQSKEYKEAGYFIKPMQYWMELLPKAIFVNYHTGGLFNLNIEITDLKIPMSWGKISE